MSKSTETAGFSAEEKAAMKERAAELRAEKRAKDKAAISEAALAEKIAELPDADRALAERIQALVKQVAPDLVGKTYYGMPAWANAEGNNVVFLQPSSKFDLRYSTLGFEQAAKLDEGTMWPTSYAITTLSEADEKRVIELVTRAIG